jgi:hypothetical protein
MKLQKTSEDKETDEDDMTECVTRMLGNLLLDCDFISCRKAMKAVLYLP